MDKVPLTTTPPDQLNSTPSAPNVSDTDRGAFVASRDDAPAYWFYETLWVVLAGVHQTGGSYTVMERWMRGGIGPALHVHNVDEWFFVLEGSMDTQVDGRELTAKPGDSIWIPRATDHGFTTTDEGAHVLNGYAPGGVEQIIVGLATPAARRELPPEDLALPSEDVLTRMNNNYWSASSDSGWSQIAPQRWGTVDEGCRFQTPKALSAEKGASMAQGPHSTDRVAHILALMKHGDDAFNRRDKAAMDAAHHPEMVAHITGNAGPIHGREAHAAAMDAMFAAFPDVHIENDPYPLQFGQGDWMTVVTKATGTFSGEMALPDGKVIPGTGKSFALNFSTTARWEGDELVEEYVFWDSALMAQQIGLA